MKTHKFTLPLSPNSIRLLSPGDKVLLSGTLYTARDKAHRRLVDLIRQGKPLPFKLPETAIFYCGPSPIPPGKVCGAIGPTTSSRMDAYTPILLEHGLRIMIGKGERSPEAQAAIKQHSALYLVATGGVAAYLSTHVTKFELFLWPELGAEAIYKMEVADFPCYVAL
jgi:fumarate hydratase subunit beta